MIYVNSVRIYPETITLETGCWYYQAYAEVCPENADCKEVTWYSDDPAIASVNYSSGYIYARSVGVTRIHAMATDGSGCCDYLTVTVKKSVPVRSVTLDHSYLSLEKGTDVTLHATVCPENATNRRLNWHSNNPNVATVSNGGTVTAISKGSTIITATAADGSLACDCCNVTVTTDILVSSVNVVPSSKVMTVGNSAYLDASICPPDASNKCVMWHSENESIATVSANGLVIAHAAGTTVIYATSCDGSDITGCCRLTVNAKIPVSGITVTPATADLKVGTRKKLTVTVSPANATDKRVRWSCGQSEIVLLDTLTGEIQAIAAGNATVTATAVDGSGVSGSCQVSVTEIPVTGISIDPTSYTMNAKSSARLKATVIPSNATNKKVTWSSSNKPVATVTQNGCVTAVSPDNAVIMVTAQGNTQKFARSHITVNQGYDPSKDTREQVQVKKDGSFFTITFSDNRIWKSVGCDLTLSENRSGYSMDPVSGMYDSLNKPEQRCVYNIHDGNKPTGYTVKQMAFIYLLDPYGVDYYLRNYTTLASTTLPQILRYKDQVYKEIFGVWPKLFKVFPDHTVQYFRYNTSMSDSYRKNFFSEAEILFGAHTISDGISWGYVIGQTFYTLVTTALSLAFPEFGSFQNLITLSKTLFFHTAVDDTLSTGSSSVLQEYVTSVAQMSTTDNAFIDRMKTGMAVVDGILNIFSTFLDASQVFVPSLREFAVYNKISAETYKTNFVVSGNSLTMEQILEHCGTPSN